MTDFLPFVNYTYLMIVSLMNFYHHFFKLKIIINYNFLSAYKKINIKFIKEFVTEFEKGIIYLFNYVKIWRTIITIKRLNFMNFINWLIIHLHQVFTICQVFTTVLFAYISFEFMNGNRIIRIVLLWKIFGYFTLRLI